MKTKNVYGIILAGGKGERLWPLSRQSKPKQFLTIANQPCLLEQTIDRIASLIPSSNLFLVTAQEQSHLISDSLIKKVGKILYEPVQRNTAPALMYAVATIAQHDPAARVIVIPSDHVIHPLKAFLETIQKAVDWCQVNEHIVLFGVRPTYAATGYGYLECANIPSLKQAEPVILFHEKPPLEKAEYYYKQPTVLWNSGMFCAQARVFIDECYHYAPEVIEAVKSFIEQGRGYENAPSISIDHAVIEKSKRVYALPAAFSWSDVGNLETFLSLLTTSQTSDNCIQIDSARNLVLPSNKLTVLIGVDDLCVVETDDALLIARRSQTEKVKQTLTELGRIGKTSYL